jgi:transposase
MKKNSIRRQSPRQAVNTSQEPITIGMDLGDRSSCYCVLDGSGEVIQEGKLATTRKGLAQVFGTMKRCRIAIEVGTHSPWVSRWLVELGHEVIVANPRQVKLISQSSRKDDRLDARTLARLVRIDPQLLRPIRHRSETAQIDLMHIRVRAGLVEMRTALVNQVRGMVKATGDRVPACGTGQMSMERIEELAEPVREALRPLLRLVEKLSAEIHDCDVKLEQIARERYPETRLLQQVSGAHRTHRGIRCLGGWRARARPWASASGRLRCGLLRLAGRGLQADWRDAELDSPRVPRRRHPGTVFPRQRDPVGGGAARCRCRCRDERAGRVARRGAVARRVPADGGVGVWTMKHQGVWSAVARPVLVGRRARASNANDALTSTPRSV